jgi:hypothetical protein
MDAGDFDQRRGLDRIVLDGRHFAEGDQVGQGDAGGQWRY